jgi:hypothetical protein
MKAKGACRTSPVRLHGSQVSQAGRLDRVNSGQRHSKTKFSSRGPSGWSPSDQMVLIMARAGGWTTLLYQWPKNKEVKHL